MAKILFHSNYLQRYTRPNWLCLCLAQRPPSNRKPPFLPIPTSRMHSTLCIVRKSLTHRWLWRVRALNHRKVHFVFLSPLFLKVKIYFVLVEVHLEVSHKVFKIYSTNWFFELHRILAFYRFPPKFETAILLTLLLLLLLHHARVFPVYKYLVYNSVMEIACLVQHVQFFAKYSSLH